MLMNGAQIGPGDKTATLGFKIGDWDEFFALKDARSNRCLDIPGDDNQVVVGANVQIWDCHNTAQDQQWFYDYDQGSLTNKANPDLCLENSNLNKKGGSFQLSHCNGSFAQQFYFDGDFIRQRSNSAMAMDAFGDRNINA